MLPSFDEFLLSIDNDEIGKEIDRLLPLHVILSENLTEAESKLASFIYQKAVTDAAKVSLLYLRKYHDWLQEQI